MIILADDLPDDAEVHTDFEYRIDDPAVQQAVETPGRVSQVANG
ncbi:hypothetical protein [Microlunatus speluncae]|nr:hypothetical protein [Microlunatus speluncae]